MNLRRFLEGIERRHAVRPGRNWGSLATHMGSEAASNVFRDPSQWTAAAEKMDRLPRGSNAPVDQEFIDRFMRFHEAFGR